MFVLMKQFQGIGLACPQVGLPWRMFIIAKTVCINPLLSNFEGSVEMEEGCLSFPGEFHKVTRPEKVTLDYYGFTGQKHKVHLEGLPARVAQHEFDHLEGRLFNGMG